MVSFQSATQEELFRATVGGLEQLGYRNGLLEHDYGFLDYFTNSRSVVPLTAFGQSPPSYKTACFGVLLPSRDGPHGPHLVEEHKSLGAPFHLEVCSDRVALWVVGKSTESTRLQREFHNGELHEAFRQHVDDWSPESVLRAKNIAFPQRNPQFDFYDFGLIPALEVQIEQKLDPILKAALAAAQEAYRSTATSKLDERDLFRLTFRLLAGKVLHDRGVGRFPTLTKDAGPDAVLRYVAEHYGEAFTRVLNLPTRKAAFDQIWSRLDFRNLSIDVLTFIWSTTLVTKEIRDALGIHTTPRTVAKYIVDRLPAESFAGLDDNGGLVVEPCCGSAVFLVEAMQRIRDQLPSNLSPEQRHDHFRRALVGFEQETFGIEVARLCLTLADFPERNRWQLYEDNVFTSNTLPTTLRNARVVLCNPPFQDLATNDLLREHVQSPHKPAEILRRIMLDLHPQGVLGLVLPRKLLDGTWYREARIGLVERFASLELASLPDIAFRQSGSEHETVLLLASQPRIGGHSSAIRHRRVSKADWPIFGHLHKPTSDDSEIMSRDEAAISLAVPQLGDVWSYLAGMPTLADVATTSRGIEWNDPLINDDHEETGHRQRLVLEVPVPGATREGVPPLAKIDSFQKPETKHLVVLPKEQRRNAYLRPWDLPKVILNAARRSRGPWRISAFADFSGLTCYRTFLAVWPNDPEMTTALAAVLNGPLANAFSATKEGFNITQSTLKTFPVPTLSELQRIEIEAAVNSYLRSAEDRNWVDAHAALLRIDALVLKGYDLPSRIERKLLDFFRGQRRPVPFQFGDYFPADFEPSFSLSDYISEEFRLSTAGAFRSRGQDVPSHILEAMERAVDSYEVE